MQNPLDELIDRHTTSEAEPQCGFCGGPFVTTFVQQRVVEGKLKCDKCQFASPSQDPSSAPPPVLTPLRWVPQIFFSGPGGKYVQGQKEDKNQ